ncbi:hypothetical protein PV416_37045 [Streptomyces ipomoeae]|nr:hypothetical protein [Streptomyces ipomoeae]MDX2826529.1 hypothetical protein [Streptomyces ipomoeae]MDX2879238.1 hypothetical protein [Streptomyces ipomoeae]
MSSTPTGMRVCALAAPILLLLYGVLRWVDGLDGAHGPGLAWNVGHTLFLIAFVLFGLLTIGLRQLHPVGTARGRLVVNSATAAGLFGVGCFLWVILTDLFADLDEAAPLPEPLEMIGPLAFQIGMLTLLALLVAGRPRRLPLWSPLSVFAGFLLIAVDLDLLPVASPLVLAGLAPLARIPGPTART